MNPTQDGAALLVVTDEAGTILAAAVTQPAAETAGAAGPIVVGLVPGEGQTLHRLAAPADMASGALPPDFADLRVIVEGGVARLARR